MDNETLIAEIVKSAKEYAEMARVMGPNVWVIFEDHITNLLANRDGIQPAPPETT